MLSYKIWIKLVFTSPSRLIKLYMKSWISKDISFYCNKLYKLYFMSCNYRKYTYEKANELNVRGWVKNTEQGTVVGQAEGREKDMARWDFSWRDEISICKLYFVATYLASNPCVNYPTYSCINMHVNIYNALCNICVHIFIKSIVFHIKILNLTDSRLGCRQKGRLNLASILPPLQMKNTSNRTHFLPLISIEAANKL